MQWDQYYKMGVVGISLSPTEFWGLSINEFWVLYEAKFPKLANKITRDDLLDMMDRHPDL
jgi:hypothetical protein